MCLYTIADQRRARTNNLYGRKSEANFWSRLTLINLHVQQYFLNAVSTTYFLTGYSDILGAEGERHDDF